MYLVVRYFPCLNENVEDYSVLFFFLPETVAIHVKLCRGYSPSLSRTRCRPLSSEDGETSDATISSTYG